jgi:hypothetical protein
MKQSYLLMELRHNSSLEDQHERANMCQLLLGDLGVGSQVGECGDCTLAAGRRLVAVAEGASCPPSDDRNQSRLHAPSSDGRQPVRTDQNGLIPMEAASFVVRRLVEQQINGQTALVIRQRAKLHLRGLVQTALVRRLIGQLVERL